MKQCHPVAYQFQNKGKFALQTFNNVYVNLPRAACRLSDGTWVMPAVPIDDLGVWKQWIGSIRVESLQKANLVLFLEQPSDKPETLDDQDKRLANDLSRLFYLVHLRSGIEYDRADLLCGLSDQGTPRIRQMSQQPKFFQTKGYQRTPITQEWLEKALTLRVGVIAMEANEAEFRRVIRGLNTLFKGLKETGQDRLHQFVRSLEALILPDIGNTKKQFAHRCQTFARPGNDTQFLLQEAFEMRSDTEHLHPWDEAVQNYPVDQREDVCWHRTRQIDRLACDAYSRVLHDATPHTPEYYSATGVQSVFRNPKRRPAALLGSDSLGSK